MEESRPDPHSAAPMGGDVAKSFGAARRIQRTTQRILIVSWNTSHRVSFYYE
jgi:hypothetical protein